MKTILKLSVLAFALLLLCGCGSEKIEKTDPNSDKVPENSEDNKQTQTKGPVTLTLGKVTATTASFESVLDIETIDDFQEVGFIYSTISEMDVELKTVTKVQITQEAYADTVTGLSYNTRYYYTIYLVRHNGICQYGEVKTFVTGNVSVSASAKGSTIVSETPVAEFAGVVKGLSEEDKSDIEVGVAYYTTSEGLKTNSSTKVAATSVISDGTFELSKQLSVDTKYYYCSYVKQNSGYVYGVEINELQTIHPYSVPSDLNVASATDLSSSASANCYIVSDSGLYKFNTVKGNSSESVGNVALASILWKTFGTSETPEYYDLIKAFCYKDGYIAFQTADTFKEGNAVIAAKDAEGNILWSWHIWLTDQPQGQVYYNNAGTMMDRNLGATSATPGDVGALGLLYQWGRKDPFLGSSSIHYESMAEAKSTITWPSPVSTNSSRGTVSYVTANPTTFVYASSSPYNWHYSFSDNLWTTSNMEKSIYDPCPQGWRVPDDRETGAVWSTALGSSSSFTESSLYSSTNKGMNFSGKFGSDQTIWYPASGSRSYHDGSLSGVGGYGLYWSANPNYRSADGLYFRSNGLVYPSYDYCRAYGNSVRCLQE